MRQTKTPPQTQNSSIFLWLRPGFNSDVDVIIKNLFCEHAFCPPVRKSNPTSIYL